MIMLPIWRRALIAKGALRMPCGGSADAITLTSGGSISDVPPVGLRVRFRALLTNTGATTIALDGGTAIACRTITGAVLPADYVRTDADTDAIFDGTYWVLDREEQRVENANGAYIRLACGAQTCTRRLTGQGPVSTASGAIYTFSASVTGLVWAAPFSSQPRVAASAQNLISGTQTWVILGGSGSATGIPNARIASAVSTGSTDFILDFIAEGKWYG